MKQPKRIIEEFKALRTRSGAYNNWLLFAGLNEAFLLSVGEQPDPVRIEFAKRKYWNGIREMAGIVTDQV